MIQAVEWPCSTHVQNVKRSGITMSKTESKRIGVFMHHGYDSNSHCELCGAPEHRIYVLHAFEELPVDIYAKWLNYSGLLKPYVGRFYDFKNYYPGSDYRRAINITMCKSCVNETLSKYSYENKIDNKEFNNQGSDQKHEC